MNVGLELFVNYDPEEVDSTLALITDGRYDSTWQKVELSRHQGFLLFSHPTTTKIERVFLLNESDSACCKEMYLKRRACLRVRNSTEQVFIRFTLYNQLLDYTRFFRFSSTKQRKEWADLLNQHGPSTNWKQSVLNLSHNTGTALRSLSNTLSRQKRRLVDNQHALVSMIKKLRI